MQFPSWTATLQEASGIDPEFEISGMLVLPRYHTKPAQQWCSVRSIKIEQRALSDNPFIGNNIQTYSDETYDYAIFLPEIAQVRNPRLLHALLKRVVQLGGKIKEDCAANYLTIAHQQVQSITSSRGEFIADYYIVSAGAWSKEILGAHVLKLDIKPIKRQMLLFKFDAPPVRTILVQKDLYIIPRRDGHLLIGSTLEDAGFDKRTTVVARDHLLKTARVILPSLQKNARSAALVRASSSLAGQYPHYWPTSSNPQLTDQ